MPNPLELVPGTERPLAIGVLFLIFVLVALLMGYVGKPMTRGEGEGIVPFEFAGNADRANEIVRSWETAGVNAAKWSLWLDFVFLFVYSALLGLACFYVANAAETAGWKGVSSIGRALATGALAAGLFDAIENVLLLRMLAKGPTDPKAKGAWVAASLKFGIAGMCVAYAALIRGFLWLLAPTT